MVPQASPGRLAVFPRRAIERLPERPGTQPDWPALKGQLIITFTSRVGSTFLCRHIERTRRASRVAETFNDRPMRTIQERRRLPSIEHAVAAQMTLGAEEGWFVAKAGVPGLLQAEHMGVFSRYEDVTSFWLLLRQDVVAQAVSLGTAKLTGQFHSTQTAARSLTDDDYDEVLLTRALASIAKGCAIILKFLSTFDKEVRLLFYESFADGDFSVVDRALDELGIPGRREPGSATRSQVTPLRRDVTEDWIERLRRSPGARDHLVRYDEILHEARERFIRTA